jgi:hypothetical protein
MKNNKIELVRYDTYQGKSVTPKNIDTLVAIPDLFNIEQNKMLHEDYDDWKKNIGVGRLLTEHKNLVNGFQKEEFKRVVQELIKNNVNNVSKFNYVSFLFGYVIKSAGWRNRLALKYSNSDIKKKNLSKDDVQNVWKNSIKTYQTASRFFYYLRLIEAKDTYNLSKVEIPKTYLVKFNKKKSNEDGNTFFVQERLSDEEYMPLNIIKDKSILLLGKNKKGDVLAQLLVAIKYAGLWDLSDGNVLVNKKTGSLALIDLEQPNTMKLEQSWNKMTEKDKKDKNNLPDRYLHSVTSGIQFLYGYSKDKAYIKKLNELVNKHPELKNHWSLRKLLEGKK